MAESVPLAGIGPGPPTTSNTEIRDHLTGDPSISPFSLTQKEKEELEKNKQLTTQKSLCLDSAVPVVEKSVLGDLTESIRTAPLPTGGGDAPRQNFSATISPQKKSLEKKTDFFPFLPPKILASDFFVAQSQKFFPTVSRTESTLTPSTTTPRSTNPQPKPVGKKTPEKIISLSPQRDFASLSAAHKATKKTLEENTTLWVVPPSDTLLPTSPTPQKPTNSGRNYSPELKTTLTQLPPKETKPLTQKKVIYPERPQSSKPTSSFAPPSNKRVSKIGSTTNKPIQDSKNNNVVNHNTQNTKTNHDNNNSNTNNNNNNMRFVNKERLSRVQFNNYYNNNNNDSNSNNNNNTPLPSKPFTQRTLDQYKSKNSTPPKNNFNSFSVLSTDSSQNSPLHSPTTVP